MAASVAGSMTVVIPVDKGETKCIKNQLPRGFSHNRMLLISV